MTTIDEDLDLRERMLIQAETLTDIARVLRPMFEQTWDSHREFETLALAARLDSDEYDSLRADFGDAAMWDAAMALALLVGGPVAQGWFSEEYITRLRADILGEK